MSVVAEEIISITALKAKSFVSFKAVSIITQIKFVCVSIDPFFSHVVGSFVARCLPRASQSLYFKNGRKQSGGGGPRGWEQETIIIIKTIFTNTLTNKTRTYSSPRRSKKMVRYLF